MSSRARLSLLLLLLLSCLVLVAVVSLRSRELRRPESVEIVQVSDLASLRPETLYEMRPIVVTQRVVDVEHLARRLLRYQYVFSRTFDVDKNAAGASQPRHTRASWTFLSFVDVGESSSSFAVPYTLRLGSPATNAVVDFKLRAYQVLVVPSHWTFSCPIADPAFVATLRVVSLYDFVDLVGMIPVPRRISHHQEERRPEVGPSV